MRSFSENESRVLQRVAVRCMYEWVTNHFLPLSRRNQQGNWDLFRRDRTLFSWDPPTHMNESCPIWINNVPHMNVLRSFAERSNPILLSPTCTCHVTHKNESRHTHVIESCRTHDWVTSHVWMSHVAHMNESCPTYEWVIIDGQWVIDPHLGVDLFICVTSNMNGSWRTYEWGTWPGTLLTLYSSYIYDWVMSHILMSHVPYMNESCPIYEWIMSHIWMSHVPYINESCPIYEWVMSHIWMSYVPYMNESCPIYEWVPYRNESWLPINNTLLTLSADYSTQCCSVC